MTIMEKTSILIDGEEMHEWYGNPELVAFCEEKGIMPPPYWNPTGTSGQWSWSEHEGRWAWEEDVQPPPLVKSTKKPWYRKFLTWR